MGLKLSQGCRTRIPRVKPKFGNPHLLNPRTPRRKDPNRKFQKPSRLFQLFPRRASWPSIADALLKDRARGLGASVSASYVVLSCHECIFKKSIYFSKVRTCTVREATALLALDMRPTKSSSHWVQNAKGLSDGTSRVLSHCKLYRTSAKKWNFG